MLGSDPNMPEDDEEDIIPETPTQGTCTSSSHVIPPPGLLLDDMEMNEQPSNGLDGHNFSARAGTETHQVTKPQNLSGRKRQKSMESEEELDNSLNSFSPLTGISPKPVGPFTNNKHLKAFPSNLTSQSTGNQNTVLIKQTSLYANKISLNPVLVAKELNKIIQDSSVKDVRINKRRNIVAVEFNPNEEEAIKTLLSTMNFGQWQVQCHRPSSDLENTCSGVIGPVGHDVDLDDLLNMQRQACKIIRISRLSKFSGASKEDSLVLKLDFEGKQIPEKAIFGFISYRVRDFNPPPLRCYRCQRHRHLSSGCTAPERCLLCAGNHSKDVCKSTTYKCANCGGPHIASHRDCRYNVQAKAIDALTRSGMSYDLALKQTNSVHHSLNSERPLQNSPSGQASQLAMPQKSLLQINTIQAEVHKSQGSYQSSLPSPSTIPSVENTYSQVTKAHAAQASNHGLTNTVAETPSMEEATATLTTLIRSEIQKLSISLCKFLKEIVLTDLSKENKKGKELLTISATRKHFGNEVAEALLGELHAESTIAAEPTTIEATPSAICLPTSSGPSNICMEGGKKNNSNPKLNHQINEPSNSEQLQSLPKRQNKTTRTSKKKKI